MGAAVERGKTDLFHLELALDRAFAERIRRCARWAPRDLRRHVGSSIDLENVSSALLAGAYAANDTALFLAGGERLGRERFLAAIRAAENKKRRRILAAAFAGTAVATNLMDDKVELARLEARFLRARIAEQTRAARIDPLGPTPFLAYALRLRGETHDLLRVIWGTASGMPRTLIAEGLATP
jgi:vacuolar-type H+-ATPase subunit C/Vma6